MSSVCHSCVGQCPEVTAVNITQNLIDLGDGAAFQNELFSVDAGTITAANTTITLDYPPVNAANLQLFRNGSLQRDGVDYTLTLATGVVVLTSAAVAGDVFQAKYLAVTA